MIPLSDLTPDEAGRLIPQRPVLVVTAGSLAHGTYVPPEDPQAIDDVDLIAVYVPELDHYFGWGRRERGLHIQEGRYDVAAYELRHFCRLLAACNPNVISALWTPHALTLACEAEGAMLIRGRELFLSRRAHQSFAGYAFGQLQRMTAYHEEKPPCWHCSGSGGLDFGGGAVACNTCGGSGKAECCPGKEFHEADCPLTKERGRGSQKKFATGYMGEKRKALVEKYGYDCKNAAHCIRLLRMGIELLREGTLNVSRLGLDADELKDIKAGRWSLMDVRMLAAGLFRDFEEAAKASVLPPEPDLRKINDLMIDILSLAHRTRVALRAHGLLYPRPDFTPYGDIGKPALRVIEEG